MMRKLMLLSAFGVLGTGVPVAQTPSAPAPAFSVSEHYTKYESLVPMRDGKRLFTSIYVPKDASHPYPFLMQRTPYNVAPYGVDRFKTRLGPSERFDRAGYIFVFQDVRGRFLSEGDFVEMTPHIDKPQSKTDVDESTDTYDTVDWLLKHVANNNGKVGIWGISYPGFFTSASIIDSHPATKAASPEASMTDLFMGDHKLWDDQVRHDTYDAYWQARDLPRHMHNINCAVLVVGGWFDAEDLAGPVRTFNAIAKNNPGYVSDPVHPVPYVGYTALNVPQEYMVSDQRFAARRPDVLVYQTPPLEKDVTIVGAVTPTLHVSTSGTDSDFVVKLIDVFPMDYPEVESARGGPPRDVAIPTEEMSGYQQLIRGEPMRGKFRTRFERPEGFIPGKVEDRRGHRIMVQVQSSWFPLVDLNPQTFVNIPDAKPADFHKATERVYRSRTAASGVQVHVLGAAAMQTRSSR